LEAAKNATIDYRLMRSGRYVHSENYLVACLHQAGFGSNEIKTTVLREEKDEQVLGFLVWASRKAPEACLGK